MTALELLTGLLQDWIDIGCANAHRRDMGR
jgi:hypothetical protein